MRALAFLLSNATRSTVWLTIILQFFFFFFCFSVWSCAISHAYTCIVCVWSVVELASIPQPRALDYYSPLVWRRISFDWIARSAGRREMALTQQQQWALSFAVRRQVHIARSWKCGIKNSICERFLEFTSDVSYCHAYVLMIHHHILLWVRS